MNLGSGARQKSHLRPTWVVPRLSPQQPGRPLGWSRMHRVLGSDEGASDPERSLCALSGGPRAGRDGPDCFKGQGGETVAGARRGRAPPSCPWRSRFPSPGPTPGFQLLSEPQVCCKCSMTGRSALKSGAHAHHHGDPPPPGVTRAPVRCTCTPRSRNQPGWALGLMDPPPPPATPRHPALPPALAGVGAAQHLPSE